MSRDLKHTYIRRGMICLTRSKSRLARLILWGQRSFKIERGGRFLFRVKREEPSNRNHGLLFSTTGYLYEVNCIESQLRHVEHNFWDNHKGDDIIVLEYVGITEEQRVGSIATMRSYLGDFYGFWKLIPQLIDNKIFFGLVVLRNFIPKKHFPYCTLSLGVSEESVGILFNGYNGKELSPDDIEDYCLAHPEEWTVICRGVVE